MGKLRHAFLAVALSLFLAASLAEADPNSPFTHVCRNKTCVKIDKSEVGPGEKSFLVDVCKLNCGDFGSLWPKPTGRVELGQDFLSFYPQNVVFLSMTTASAEVKATLDEAIQIFKEYLLQYHPDYKHDGISPFPGNSEGDIISKNSLIINIDVVSDERNVRLGGDESYGLSLQVNDQKNLVATIVEANTYFGARNALETLSQLMAYDEDTNSLKIVDTATISDAPIFTYRGAHIDTSRNYLPISKIRRVIDGMSYSKLNILHWHITDTHSFPFVSKSVPEMSKYGAYSAKKIYTAQEIKDLVEYAKVRGVKIVGEFDAPSHTGNGWQWGPAAGKGELALCINKEPWATYCLEPPCGQLNLANENMYEVLGRIYQDLLEVFDNDLFHMGGDEIVNNCWLENAEITEYLRQQGKENTEDTLLDLWGQFQARAYNLVKAGQRVPANNVTAILWTSELVSIKHVKEYISTEDYIVQIWSTGDDPVIPFLIKNGYKTVFSNYDAWYLDCGFGNWVGEGNNWCSPYKGWQTVYANNPLKLLLSGLTQEEIDAAYRAGQIVGGEAALWAEQVDETTLEGKLWPRLSALAERLWSNPESSWYDAEPRMLQTRQRYVQRGLLPDRLQPEWCRQNDRHCYG